MSALENDCELSVSDWQSKMVEMSADGAAVNFGSRSAVTKRLCDFVPHLVSVHCCAHRHLAKKPSVEMFLSLEHWRIL